VLVGLAYYLFVALSHIRTEDGYYLVSYASLALLGVWAVRTLAQRGWRASGALGRAGLASWPGGRAGLASWPGVLSLLSLAVLATFLVRVGLSYELGSPSGPARTVPELAIIEALTQPGERIFVAPYDPYVYLASQRMPAARLPFYFPWQAIDPRSREQLLADLRTNRPPVIIFRHAEAVNDRWVAGDYGRSLLEALAPDYAPLDPAAPVLSDVLVPRERLAAAQQRVAALR
jgi:hypothetical protein